MDASSFHAAVAAVCPIDGIETGHEIFLDGDGEPRRNDDGSIVRGAPYTRIQFAAAATPEQRAAAEAVLAAYDPSDDAKSKALDAARGYVAAHIPGSVRASMNSYWLSILNKTDEISVADVTKLHAIEAWETSVLESTSGHPPPPPWLAAFVMQF